MSFFANLFGKKPETPPPTPATLPPGAPATIKAWDDYGRICEIPREEWRTKVLPANFQKTWNNPDQLAALINSALNDHFISDSLEPARRLYRIDTQPTRGAIYLAVVLLQLKKFDEAEKVVTETIRKHGEDGVLLTNLAKVQSGRGQNELSEQTLWHALELDPNQDNALLWYQAIYRDRGGEAASLDAFRRVAALPGSWRPQMWLARAALQTRNLDAALALYQEALQRAGDPLPTDLLRQMSGDLGNAAHLPELLRLTGPHFDAKIHGLPVGNNLIKAHLDLGQFDAARKILDQLYALNRGDWKENLNYWETEISKARIAVSAPEPDQQLKTTMLTLDGPVWLKPDSPAAELFPARPNDNLGIAFLGGTGNIATNSKRIELQLSNTTGRMSRMLPLFLAEQVTFNSGAHTHTLIPWLMGDSPGFIFSGVAWKDEDAANYARQGAVKYDFVVVTHLKTTAEPWLVELRLVRTIDGKCLGQLTASWPFTRPEAGLFNLARQLLDLLAAQAEASMNEPAPAYQVPAAPHFANYLLRLEQLLAVRCSTIDGVPKSFLSGEREIMDGNLQLCLDQPQNLVTRIVLAQTLAAMKRVRPDILPEYKDKIARLQKEKPLTEPAHSVVQRIINEVFA